MKCFHAAFQLNLRNSCLHCCKIIEDEFVRLVTSFRRHFSLWHVCPRERILTFVCKVQFVIYCGNFHKCFSLNSHLFGQNACVSILVFDIKLLLFIQYDNILMFVIKYLLVLMCLSVYGTSVIRCSPIMHRYRICFMFCAVTIQARLNYRILVIWQFFKGFSSFVSFFRDLVVQYYHSCLNIIIIPLQ